jgi:multicomponent Na+:H+ antiporter subunit B
MTMILNIGLLLMAGAALVACESADLMVGVIAVAAFGAVSSAMFILLGARDVGILQMVIEVAALLIVINYTGKKYHKEVYTGRQVLGYMVVLVFMALMLYSSVPVIDRLLELNSKAAPHEELAKYFRSFDIIAASAALFAAIVGIMAVLRPKEDKESK